MAGQSVGLVHSIQPVAEIIAELIDQAAGALVARDARTLRLDRPPPEAVVPA